MVSNDWAYNVNGVYMQEKKAASSDGGFCSRNFRMADEGKETVEAVTLPDSKDDVGNDDGIADAPPIPSHNEAYSLINKLMIVGGTK